MKFLKFVIRVAVSVVFAIGMLALLKVVSPTMMVAFLAIMYVNAMWAATESELNLTQNKYFK